MPLVKAIVQLADGFSIITTAKGTVTVSSADLTAQQKLMTTTQVEAIAQPFLASRLPANMFVAVHLTSVNPMLGFILVSDVPITGSWWL